MKRLIVSMLLVMASQAYAAGPSVFEIGNDTGTAAVLISATQVTIVDIEVDTGKLGDSICCYNAGDTTGVPTTCKKGTVKDVNGATLDSSKIANVVVVGVLDSQKLLSPMRAPRNGARGAVCEASASSISGRIIYQQP